ncbi:MAG: HD domain-containing phosphohydrolase [Acidobacteriota bacterium]
MPAPIPDWSTLEPRSRFVMLAVNTAGAAVLAMSVLRWHSASSQLFIGYLALAILAAAVRVKLPGSHSVLSLHFFIILLALPRLSLAETLVVGCAGILLQTLVFSTRPRAFDTLFLLAAVVLSSGSAWGVYGLSMRNDASRSPLALVLSAGVFFAVQTCLINFPVSVAEQQPFLKLWRERYFWTFPHYVAGGGVAGLVNLVDRNARWETALLTLPVVYWMFNAYRYYLKVVHDKNREVRELGGLHFRTIEALALAIDGHDPTKQGHLRRVSIYVTEVGRLMGLPDLELKALHAASLLHDIGKLAVPDHIIMKAGKLTDIEFERMKIHPVAGAEILEQVQFPYPVAPIVRAHHEKWDGTGYPAGLRGAKIPVGARILAAVDCLDALVSERRHRQALSIEQAIEYLKSESGKSFDPEVVAMIWTRYRELEDKVRASEQYDLQIGGLMAAPGRSAEIQASGALLAPGPVRTEFLGRIAAARQEEQQFFQLARELGNSLSLDTTLAVCADRIRSLCPYDAIAILLRRDNTLSTEFAGGLHSEYLSAFTIPMGAGVCGWVAEHRTPVVNGDPAAELAACGALAAAEFKSLLAVPLEGAGGVVGVISLYSRTRDAFLADHLRLLSAIALRAATAIENAVKYNQAERSATTDVLTGLPNARSLFLHLDAELARAKRHTETLAVLVCDLDRFKQVNDILGHMTGNRALRAIAQSLKKQCREYDFVARMGGDEFVVVLPTYKQGSVIPKIDQLQKSAAIAGAEVAGKLGLGISVGYACFPEDGDDAETLLAAADRRMYRMKQSSVSRTAESTTEELRKLGETLGPRDTIQ